MTSRSKGNRMAGASAQAGKAGDNLSPRKKEVIGLVSFCAGLVTLLSLVSYAPADGFGFGTGAAARNMIGPAGAAWAFVLLKVLGVSAYVVVAGLLMLAVAAIRHLEIKVQLFETVGWALLTVFSSAFIQVALSGRHVMGVEPGGFVGLYMARGLVALFSGVGALIILSVLILLSLLMATDISIKSAAICTGLATAASAKFAWRTGDAALARVLPAPDEGDDGQTDGPVIVVPEGRNSEGRKDEGRQDERTRDEEEKGEARKDKGRKDNGTRDEKAKEAKVVELSAVRERKKKEDAGPEIIVISKPKKKVRKEPDDDRPIYDPSKGFVLPSPSLLSGGAQKEFGFDSDALKENAQLLEARLKDYGIDGKVMSIRPGPVITMYEFKPAPGIKVARIANLEKDLAMALAAIRVRVVAPIPGKDVVGIEVPNKDRNTVYLREIVESPSFNQAGVTLGMALGKDTEGTPYSVDLVKMPHLLVAGTTGAGKSVSVNCMIMSMLFKKTPEEVKLVLVDPKMVELKLYEGIPHLLLPVVTDPKKAALALRWAVEEMERRYQLLADLSVREIATYNQEVDRILKGEKPMPETLKAKIEESRQAALTGIGPDGKPAPDARPYELQKIPYIVIVVDEFADLMMVASRDVEQSVARLAQMARAVGLHIILATQRPSTDVISGLIKNNFPARIAFQVPTQIDSRTILDSPGAENLVGRGDMLLLPPGEPAPMRIHGAFVNETGIKAVIDFIKAQGKPVYNEEILKPRAGDGEGPAEGEEGDENDELYAQAVEIVLRERKASISYLQRRLQVGYNRAARMIELMETEGILSAPDGKGQREIMRPPV